MRVLINRFQAQLRGCGIALLPPSTLIAILPFLSSHTSPSIRALKLPSSLMVLYTPYYSPPIMLSRLVSRLTPLPNATHEPSLSLIEISAYEGLPIGLAKELMEEVEATRPSDEAREVAGVVRDEQAGQEAGGVRWYRDLISPWRFEV